MKTRSLKLMAIAIVSMPLLLNSAAEARVPDGPTLDSLSAGCKLLQNEGDSLLREYAGDKTPERADAILARLRAIGSSWDQICKGAFGSISSKNCRNQAKKCLTRN